MRFPPHFDGGGGRALLLLLSLDAVHSTETSATVNSVVVRCGSGDGDGGAPLVCGPNAPLRVTAQMTLPVSVTNATALTLPMALAGDSVCWLNGDDVPLTVTAASLTAYDKQSTLWQVEVNCSLPESSAALDSLNGEDAGASDDEIPFQCDLSAAFNDGSTAVPVAVDTALPPLTYLSSAWAITNVSLVVEAWNDDKDVESVVVGINQTATMALQVTGSGASAREQTLSGSCIVNHEPCSVSAGQFHYVVQENDSDFSSGLEYSCSVTDGADNALSQQGVILHSIQQIDGSQPEIADVFMLFSTDKPAHVGSVISVTLRAVGLASGYSGRCTVNGVPDRPLLQAEDDGFYMTQYTVSRGDRSTGSVQSESGGSAPVLPLDCIVANSVGNTARFQRQVPLDFAIDPDPPNVTSTLILFSSDHPAHEGSVIEIQVTMSKPEPNLQIVTVDESDIANGTAASNSTSRSCLVNNVSVAHSFSLASPESFIVTYVVGDLDASWKAGELPISCAIRDAAGNIAVVDHFTDDNTLFARALKPVEIEAELIMSLAYLPDPALLLRFALLAIASQVISKLCPYLGLPRITGYLVTGVVVGPYVLNLLERPQLHQLRVLDELAMAYIGLTAGSKLHWNSMRPMLSSILLVTLLLAVSQYIIGTVTVAVLAESIDFLQDTTNAEKFAISVLAGCMMIATSPSSALAIIEEIKARGRFTTLIFAVTVMCDVTVIFLFNITSMVAESLLAKQELSIGAQVLRLVLQLTLSIAAGAVLGKLVALVILYRPRALKRKSRWSPLRRAGKQALLLGYGWGVFLVSHLAHPYLEPLLCCMVSGTVMWNASPHPEELGELLHGLANLVYVCFFTITGATLELDMLVKAIALSSVLCLTRVAAIFLGSCAGGLCAGEDPRHARVAWMAYVTQAGVTLGLAKQIQLLYPGWGSYFATMIVAVVICNQVLGPPMLRYVLRRVGDARSKAAVGKVDGLSALVLTRHVGTSGDLYDQGPGMESVLGPVARLEMCGWHVHSHAIQAISDDDCEAESDKLTMKHRAIDKKLKKKKAEERGDALPDEGDSLESSALQREVLEAVRDSTPDVAIVLMPSDEQNAHVIRAISEACHELRRLRVLRVVVLVATTDHHVEVGSDAVDWSSVFADMPATERHGDTIDVVVVDRREATDMLLELAARGKVVSTAVIMGSDSPGATSTAIETMEEGEMSDHGGRKADEGEPVHVPADGPLLQEQAPRATRLRRSLSRTVRRLMLV